MSARVNPTVSFPVASILGIAFIILKLTGVVAWSWWWVLLPFWGPLALGLLVFGVVALLFFIADRQLKRQRHATRTRAAYAHVHGGPR